jgi:hypothetical protein
MKTKQKLPTAAQQYPELAQIAQVVADDACRAINRMSMAVTSEARYKAQCVLEMVVQALDERI